MKQDIPPKCTHMTNTNDRRAIDRGWRAIFDKYRIGDHNFDQSPFQITAQQIKDACQHFRQTSEKEPYVLCKQTTKNMRPFVFRQNNLFILPIKNGVYVINRGEGYIDIPPITAAITTYSSQLDFSLRTAKIGNSEMQHLDYAYAISMMRDFIGDQSLVLTIRGRKYTPKFSFKVGDFDITAKSVQTKVDSGYEGRERIVLVKAKNTNMTNTIIRQLYYPYRQWEIHTQKKVSTVFFERKESSGEYHFWEFGFTDKNNYNSISLKRTARYKMMNDH